MIKIRKLKNMNRTYYFVMTFTRYMTDLKPRSPIPTSFLHQDLKTKKENKNIIPKQTVVSVFSNFLQRFGETIWAIHAIEKYVDATSPCCIYIQEEKNMGNLGLLV
jgi:hypothetical protein